MKYILQDLPNENVSQGKHFLDTEVYKTSFKAQKIHGDCKIGEEYITV